MRLKNGKQACPKCQSNGCYWCRRKGWIAQCPVCMNHEPELVSKDGDDFHCLACDERFDSSGRLIPKTPPKKKPSWPPITKTT